MKRLALFCDGTWSDARPRFGLEHTGAERKGSGSETNVARLFRAVAAADGADQTCGYVGGLGARRLPVLGGLFGEGLEAKIIEAYLWLCERYVFGAAVYLFGFSRGAYTVRSLVGLIRRAGFLAKPYPRRAQQAMALYRRRSGPDTPEAIAFRRDHACAFVTADAAGLRLEQAGAGATRPHAIQFLGVWDTVGALGVPARWPLSHVINRRHHFHDTALSRMVAHAAHALAADERRAAFEAAAWSNLPALNRGLDAPRYVQAWFPGDHGSVGGGGQERRLSDGGLVWMAERAAAAGLKLDLNHPELASARANADPLTGPLHNAPKGLLSRLTPQRDRAPMLTGDEAHSGALARMAADRLYRPTPLRPVWPK